MESEADIRFYRILQRVSLGLESNYIDVFIWKSSCYVFGGHNYEGRNSISSADSIYVSSEGSIGHIRHFQNVLCGLETCLW